MRRKINKADELYLKQNRYKSTAELSKELDLSEKSIKDFIKSLPVETKSIVKRARLKSKGKTIGVQLTEELSDTGNYTPPDPLSGPHIFRFKNSNDD